MSNKAEQLSNEYIGSSNQAVTPIKMTICS